MNFLKNILYKLKELLGLNEEAEPIRQSPVETQTDPKTGVILSEPMLAFQDGFLVMVVDHHFANIPSWVEWDAERGIVSITQMNGDMDEARVNLKKEAIERLKLEQKILLVSNDNGQTVSQFIPFLARD